MKIEDITVLIVDDHLSTIAEVKNCLITHFKLLPKNIKGTPDAREALAIIQIEEPNMIFVDLNLQGSADGYGDGGLLLKSITEKYENCPDYTPFRIVMTSHASPEVQKSVADYSDFFTSKHFDNYPAFAFQRYLLSLKAEFQQPQISINETGYMAQLTAHIIDELTPYGYSKLKPGQQNYVVELICLIIPSIDKRTSNFNHFYKEIAKNFDIPSARTIKTIISRAFNDVFLKTETILELYTDGNGKSMPKQKDFYIFIATKVKNKISTK